MRTEASTHVATPADLPSGAGELGWEDLAGLHLEDNEALAGLGRRLGARGQVREALFVFEEMVRRSPEDPMAHTALGTAFEALGDYEQARLGYERALALVEGHVAALAARGELRLRRGDEGGLDDLAAAARLDPQGLTRAGRRARRRLEEDLRELAAPLLGEGLA